MIWDIDSDGFEVVIKEIEVVGGVVYFYKCNLRDRNEIYKIVKKVREDVGEVFFLINNVGIILGKKLLEISDEEILVIFDVNFFVYFWVSF